MSDIPVFAEGNDITRTVVFSDQIGSASVTNASYSVLDQTGTVLVADTAIAGPYQGIGQFPVTVPAAFNAVSSTDDTRSLREIRLKLTTSAGVIYVKDRYIVEAVEPLSLMVNSVQTYGDALLTASSMYGLDGWDMASDSDRQRALKLAFQRMRKLSYRTSKFYDRNADPTQMLAADQIYTIIQDLTWITPQIWATYKDDFRDALKRCQIQEADVILNGDVVGAKRRAGIVSERVGEAAMVFKGGKPLSFPIAQESMAHISGYVFKRIYMARG